MSATNRGTLPAAAIASVVAASLALGTSVPITRSRTVTRCPGRRSRVDSPIRVAAAGTATVSSSDRRSRATSAVISFVMLAIARGVSASRAARVWPSTELWTTYARAWTAGAAPCAGVAETTTATTATARPQRITVPQGSRRPVVLGAHTDALADTQHLGIDSGVEARQRGDRRTGPCGDSLQRVARAHGDDRRPGRRGHACRRARRRRGVLPEAGPDEQHGDRDRQQKRDGSRDTGYPRPVDPALRHHPAAVQTAAESRAASAPAAARQSSGGASRYA